MKQIDMLVVHGTVLLGDPLLRDFRVLSLAVHQGVIINIGEADTLEQQYHAARVVDASGKYIYPGLISTHTHLFQTFLKGLGRDKPLLAWLDASIRKALKYFTYGNVQTAALLGLSELVRCGVTTVADYQYCHTEPFLDKAVIEAFTKIGMRGMVYSSRTDVSSFPEDIRPKYCETEEQFLLQLGALSKEFKDDNLLTIGAAPGIIWDMSEEGYRTLANLQKELDVRISMHCLETEDDDSFSKKTYGKTTMEFLEDCGILNDHFLAVHAVHMHDHDFEIFSRNTIAVSHCPVSNMILASGISDVPKMIEKGITVSLATDGAASNDSQDMFEVLKCTALQHKVQTRDASCMPAPTVLSLATLGGAKALGMEDSIGTLEKGKRADFFIYQPLDCRSIPIHDPLSTLIYASGRQNVEMTVIDGKVVYESGNILGIDENQLLLDAQNQAAKIRIAANL